MLLWLFKGGIDFVIADNIGVNLRYEGELFPVKVDLNYLLSYLSYYVYYLSYFLVCVIYIMSSKCIPVGRSVFNDSSRLGYVFFLCIFFVLIYLYYGITMFRDAMGSGMSIYHYSRFNGGETKSIMTLASWISVACGVLGFGISNGKYKFYFLIMLILVFLISAVLGNRHILLSGLFLYLVLFHDTEKYSFKKIISIISVMTVGLSLIMSIYVVREADEGDFLTVNTEKIQESVINVFSSSEFIYAHMSMYGVISNNVEPYYGKSLMFLVSAALPRFINGSREDDVYTYYINEVNDNPFKGFSIANPTGWYLNFGAIGLTIGGITLALIACFLHRLSYYGSSKSRVFFFLIFALFISDSIGFMRSGGPEPLRAVLLIKSIIPASIIYFGLRYRLRLLKYS